MLRRVERKPSEDKQWLLGVFTPFSLFVAEELDQSAKGPNFTYDL